MLMTSILILLFMAMLGYNLIHTLNCLIFMELLVLYSFWVLLSLSFSSVIQFGGLALYFVITVSSAALGLSILVNICRSHGQDFLLSYNLSF